MKETGGYFELELPERTEKYHEHAVKLKSGRAALQHLLCSTRPAMVYIPFYTCNALLTPFINTGTAYKFYSINERLEPAEDIELKQGEYFLYINYLDLKRDTVASMSEKYKNKLIVDCTQAFFMKGNNVSWFFNSCRKFFGVPDGAYLYAPHGCSLPRPHEQNENYNTTHLLHRFNGHTAAGYPSFTQNEILAGEGLTAMSKLSEHLLSLINYEDVIDKRRKNFNRLHTHLSNRNLFQYTNYGHGVPMSYPLLAGKRISRETLADSRLYVPTLWHDVSEREAVGFAFEKTFAAMLCPLPSDHRYSVTDMDQLVQTLIPLL